MKMHNFRSDLTDTAAKNEPLDMTSSLVQSQAKVVYHTPGIPISCYQQQQVPNHQRDSAATGPILGKPHWTYNQTEETRTKYARLSSFFRTSIAIPSPGICEAHLTVWTWYCRASYYWITSGKKTNVYRGTRGSRRSAYGPNENLKKQLSSRREYLPSLVIFVLVLSTNREMKIQIVVIQHYRNSIITGSASFIAETSVRSPWKIFIFIIL